MNASLTILQIAGLVLAGVVAGMGLPMLGLAGISGGSRDDPIPGFIAKVGMFCLGAGCAIAIWVLRAG